MTTSYDKHDGKAGKRPSFLYNPYEIAFRGFWGTDWMFLSQQMAGAITDRSVAVVLHGELEGDTTEPPEFTWARSSDDLNRVVYPATGQERVKPLPILDADVAFVETAAELGLPQVVLGHAARAEDKNVMAYVTHHDDDTDLPGEVPRFDVELELPLLARCIGKHLRELAKAVPLYGLVLAGGKSTRMKQDKASLDYHGKPQVAHCYELLSGYCERVFVSNRSDQTVESAQQGLPQIHDTFLEIGPTGGILSALRAHPKAAWLVLACDLPFVDGTAIAALLKGRNPFKLATAFISEHDGMPEPLCAVYEPKSIFRLLHFLALGYTCPRKVLINSDTCLLEQPTANVMTNVNSPDEYAEAQRVLAREGNVAG